MSQTDISDTARILSEALPFLQRYDDQVIVVKFGGHAMVDPKLAHQFDIHMTPVYSPPRSTSHAGVGASHGSLKLPS